MPAALRPAAAWRSAWARAPLCGGAILVIAALLLLLKGPLWLGLALVATGLLAAWWFRSRPRLALTLLLCSLTVLGALGQQARQRAELAAVLAEVRSQPREGWRLMVWQLPSRTAELASPRVIARLEEPGLPRLMVAVQADQPMTVGRVVFVRGNLRPVSRALNPGSFDRRAWLASLGVELELVGSLREQQPKTGWRGREWLAQGSAWLVDRLVADLPESAGKQVLPALVLGFSGEIDPSLNLAFRNSGALHLFAVSGLHVSLIALLFLWLLRPLPRRLRWLVVLLLLAVFIVITGARPSAMRALMMFLILGLGILRGRPHAALNALGAAALLELGFHPRSLADAGFQFSYLVVLGILAVATPLQRLVLNGKHFQRDPLLPPQLESWRGRSQRWLAHFLVASALISAIAWAASLPIQLSRFGLWNPGAPLVNLVLVPISTIALFSAVLGLLASLPWRPLGWPLRRVGQFFCSSMVWGAQQGAELGPHWQLDRDPARGTRLTVLAMRDGAAQLIEHEGYRILIDCGSAGEYPWQLENFLRYRGVERLDALVLTHADGKHIGGAVPLLERLPVAQLIVGPGDGASPAWSAALEMARARGVPIQRVSAGAEAELGSAHLRVLHPPGQQRPGRADDDALVLLVESAAGRWLLTSDAGWSAERLLAQQPELRGGVDVVVQGQDRRTGGGVPAFWSVLLAGATEARPLWRVHSSLADSLENDPDSAPTEATAPLQLFDPERHGAIILEAKDGGVSLRGWADGLRVWQGARPVRAAAGEGPEAGVD